MLNQLQDRFILRQIRVKNFIRFKEEQILDFPKNNAYLLIGKNQSGKSSVFEAVRRCLSLESNSTTSTISDDEDDAIFVCTFKCAESGRRLISFFIRFANRGKEFIKGCVMLESISNASRLEIDRVNYGQEREVVKLEEFKLAEDFELDNVFKGDDWKLEDMIQWVKDIVEGNIDTVEDKSGGNGQGKTKCEKLLKDNLDDRVITTFSLRGIGPCQWSKSKRIMNKNKDNYTEACEKAEIIKWFYENEQTEADENLEKEFYEIITDKEGGTYGMDEKGELVVRYGGKPLPLLKQSEGFHEAKACSILMAVQHFSTILFEDPSTGMHKQMVERLVYLINQRVNKKVVIISTHNPAFIESSLTEVANIYTFHRVSPTDFEIISGETLKKEEVLDAIPGSISREQFANFCFAKTIVFVEGPSDLLFMEAMQTVMRNAFNQRLTGVQFVPLHGAYKKRKFEKCCISLKKKYAFILDGDVKGEIKGTYAQSESQSFEEHIGKKNYLQLNFQNIEDFLFSALAEVKQKNIFISDIKEVLERCFPKENLEIEGREIKRVSYSVPKKDQATNKDDVQDMLRKKLKLDKTVIKQLRKDCTVGSDSHIVLSELEKAKQQKQEKKFKLFLNSQETTDDRVTLLEFLLSLKGDFAESKPGKEFKRIRDFLGQLDMQS